MHRVALLHEGNVQVGFMRDAGLGSLLSPPGYAQYALVMPQAQSFLNVSRNQNRSPYYVFDLCCKRRSTEEGRGLLAACTRGYCPEQRQTSISSCQKGTAVSLQHLHLDPLPPSPGQAAKVTFPPSISHSRAVQSRLADAHRPQGLTLRPYTAP